MITVIDLGINNLGSLLHAFQLIGAEVRTTQSARDVRDASALLLPGVGAFGMAMSRLDEYGLVEEIRSHTLERRRPMVGICLGMQLLLEGSEEYGKYQGLGLIRGHAAAMVATHGRDLVPRLGWADVRMERSHDFVPPTAAPRAFYFAHSYHAVCEDPTSTVATTPFDGRSISAIIASENVMGCQFHPEKSQDPGMDFLAYMVPRITHANVSGIVVAS